MKKKKKIKKNGEDEPKTMYENKMFLRALFRRDIYCNVLFTSDDRKWQYAIKFQHKLKATEITKIFTFIFKKKILADYELRPDMTGDAVWFVFDILGDNVKIGS